MQWLRAKGLRLRARPGRIQKWIGFDMRRRGPALPNMSYSSTYPLNPEPQTLNLSRMRKTRAAPLGDQKIVLGTLVSCCISLLYDNDVVRVL